MGKSLGNGLWAIQPPYIEPLKSAGNVCTDYGEFWCERTDEFKPSAVVVNCPFCGRRFHPLLSKYTKSVKSGSYYPPHSVVTGSITFFTLHHTYCRKCKNKFEFTTSNDS